LDDLIVGTPYKIQNGISKVGKFHVIFGKKDNTAIDLSAILTVNNKPSCATGNSRQVDCCAVGFTEDNIRLTCV
jgi:hypothetical protein